MRETVWQLLLSTSVMVKRDGMENGGTWWAAYVVFPLRSPFYVEDVTFIPIEF